jgi:predicted Zn-dependent protease
VHEVGHVLGLGHMQLQKGYLMSPQFDFWETNEQLPITRLELDALVKAYGTDGFS